MILGVDTSNYTTSVAGVSKNSILYDERQLLFVKQGERGLRQSDAFYQHINQLPILYQKIQNDSIEAVGVSTRPRRTEGSYMPCFKAGIAVASIIAKDFHVPLYEVSHQEGHIAAALHGNSSIDPNHFLCVQLSGGTTEILLVEKDSQGFSANIQGKTIDISAGQLLDRIGVACGLSFPCGRFIDENYIDQDEILVRPSIREDTVSYAGIETKFRSFLQSGFDPVVVCSAVLDHIAVSIRNLVYRISKRTNVSQVLFTGGVCSSVHLRIMLQKLEDDGIQLFFSQNGLSSDNAVGVALIAQRILKED